MATAEFRAPGGKAAAEFIEQRFGLTWGPDILGIAEDGFSVESSRGDTGIMKLTLVGECSREDAQRILDLLWSKPSIEGEKR